MTSATKGDEVALQRYVTDFMATSGAQRTHELEARVRGGVSAAAFSSVLRRLQGSGRGMWAFTLVEESMDVTFSDRSRTTVAQAPAAAVAAAAAAGAPPPPPPPPVRVRKRRLADPHDFELLDAATGRAIPFRVSCAEEEPLPAPAAPLAAAPEVFRLKKRHSFNRKNEMQFDLTEVRSGGSLDAARRAPPVFEVELEWRGQENAARGAYAGAGGAPRMAEVFLCKLRDLCALVAGAFGEEERGAAAAAAGGGGTELGGSGGGPGRGATGAGGGGGGGGGGPGKGAAGSGAGGGGGGSGGGGDGSGGGGAPPAPPPAGPPPQQRAAAAGVKRARLEQAGAPAEKGGEQGGAPADEGP